MIQLGCLGLMQLGLYSLCFSCLEINEELKEQLSLSQFEICPYISVLSAYHLYQYPLARLDVTLIVLLFLNSPLINLGTFDNSC